MSIFPPGLFVARTLSAIGLSVLLIATVQGQSRKQTIAFQTRSKIKVAWTMQLDSPSFGSAAVADIDDDGRLEIAFGTYFGDNSVRVLNGEDGSQYWRFDAGNACVDASLRFADLDRDGSLELVVPISNLGWVLSFDAKTGNENWRYSTSPIECTDTPPAIVDLDQDGDLEVLYGTFAGKLHAISKEGKRKNVFQATRHFVQSGPIARDLNGDGIRDLICATFKGDNSIYAVNGITKQTLWKFKVPGEHMGMYHGPSVGDIDQDGELELVFGAYDGRVYCLQASDGKKKWRTDTKDSYIMSPTVIADLDQNGAFEIIIASQYMTVLDSNGKVKWSHSCSGGGHDCAARGASVADLNGDGKLDVASLSGSGLFKVFDGVSGNPIYSYDSSVLSSGSVRSSSHGVTIADLTGDGKLDVFFVIGGTHPQRHGTAICLTGFKGTGAGWYMLRHDPENTGNLATPLDKHLLRRIENLTPQKPAVTRPAKRPRVGPIPPPGKVAGNPAGNESGGKPGPNPVRSRANREKLTESIYQEADKRGIARATLNAAYHIDADFKKHGAEGFKAVCLLIEHGKHKGTLSTPLLYATWEPGLEKELLKLCSRDRLPNYGLWSALKGLGSADTPEVRTYLLNRIKTERDPGLYMSAAAALGKLGEKKAIDPVGKQILRFEKNWSGVEPHLLISIYQMGNKQALPWLERFVKHEKAKRFWIAISCISRSDRELARELAGNVLKTRTNLDGRERRFLQRLMVD